MEDLPFPVKPPNRTWQSGALRWLKLTSTPSIAAAATTLFTLLGVSLLYRTLPETQAGQLALLLSLAEISSVVCAHGMPIVATRIYTPASAGHHDWPMDVTLSTAVGLAPAAILSGAAFLLYELPASGMIYLPCSLVMLTGLQVTAGMLNVARRYAWSAALLRLPNSMLFLAWIAGEIDPALSSLHVALAFHLATMCFSLFLGLAVLRKSLPRGTRRIPLGQHLSGIAFVGSSLATVLPEQGIVAVAGRVLAPAEVAAFAAAAILLRPFRLARSILTGILMPELIRRGRGGYQRYFAALGGLASCAGLIAALVLPPLARWFYGPRYIQAASVIPILAVGGAIHLMTVVQKSDYSGRAPTSGINRYVATLVLGLTAALLLGAVLVARIGVRGAATGVLMAELTEWAVTLGFWLRFRHHETFARSDA